MSDQENLSDLLRRLRESLGEEMAPADPAPEETPAENPAENEVQETAGAPWEILADALSPTPSDPTAEEEPANDPLAAEEPADEPVEEPVEEPFLAAETADMAAALDTELPAMRTTDYDIPVADELIVDAAADDIEETEDRTGAIHAIADEDAATLSEEELAETRAFRLEDEMITRSDEAIRTDAFARVETSAPDPAATIRMDAAVPDEAPRFADTGVLSAAAAELPIEDEDGTDDTLLSVGTEPDPHDPDNFKGALTGSFKRVNNTFRVGDEYADRAQIDALRNALRTRLNFARVRFVLITLLAAFLYFFENVGALGYELPGAFNAGLYPRVSVLIDLQALTFAVALSYHALTDGVRDLFRGRPKSTSLLFLLTLGNLVYDALLLWRAESEPLLCALPCCLFCACVALSDILRVKSDGAAFAILAAPGDKLAACVMQNGNARSEQEQFSFDKKAKEYKILRVKKVGFVDGFLRRSRTAIEDRATSAFLLIASLISSVLMGVLACVLKDFDLLGGAGVALFTLSVTTPLGALFTHTYPMRRTSAIAYAGNSALVGESSAEEYASVNALSFEDIEMFPSRSVKVRRIKLYGENRLDSVLYDVAGVFSAVGGPLAEVFGGATAEMGASRDVSLEDATDDGLIARVDGKLVCVGKGSFMQRRGITLSYDAEDEKQSADRNVGILFAATDGALCAKFYIRYTVDAAFEKSVARLYASGIRAVIRTFDPNIDNAMVSRMCYSEDTTVRVVKKAKFQLRDFAQPRIDSGIVTGGVSGDILHVLLLSRKLLRVVRRNRVLQILSFAVGLSAAALWTLLTGKPLHSAWALAGMLLLMLPTFLFPKNKPQ